MAWPISFSLGGERRKAMKRPLVTAMILASCLAGTISQTSEGKPEKLTLTLAWIADSKNAGSGEYVFVINGLGAYRTLEGLKKYISGLPKGSVLTWAPTCRRMGDEPLLSSSQEMEKFKAFCESCGIGFILIPSG
jgi:hypothetical protein